VPEPGAGDVVLARMGALVDGLADGGMTDACLSPGLRSAPIALALARRGGVAIHVILDERSSCFFALGLAKATGRPVAVVTTSGTAVANLLPAVVEAAQSGTPLLVLSADRPPELRGAGANQTIDQVGIFGVFVRWENDAPVPQDGPGGTGWWRELGSKAAGEALRSPGGPVHLNLPFREPVAPSGPGGLAKSPRRAAGANARSVRAAPDPEAVEELAALISGTEPGLILAGSLDPWLQDEDLAAVEALADASGWPLLAEPLSGLRRSSRALAAGQHLLMDQEFAREHVPEVVLQLGATPTTRAGQELVARAGRLVVVSSRPADPFRRATATWDTDPCLLAAKAGGEIDPRHGPTSWLRAWRAADVAASGAVDGVLAAVDEPFEGRLARDVAGALPNGSTLFAGSSMPVRDLDMYMVPRPGLRVVGNRGASGIDGSVSTVLGIAASGVPTFALIGDLALLHDAGGLLWSARTGLDAVLVVPNNRGGGIFDHLDIAAEPEHELLFVTPHDLDLSALADTAAAGYQKVPRADQVSDVVRSAGQAGGVHVIEVPIDRATGLGVRAEVRAAVRLALAASDPGT
jgi:2-succinyl-5-enolpyruvyl-6-hydroxy-3-cyclohexene-1-carboxylate synthase